MKEFLITLFCVSSLSAWSQTRDALTLQLSSDVIVMSSYSNFRPLNSYGLTYERVYMNGWGWSVGLLKSEYNEAVKLTPMVESQPAQLPYMESVRLNYVTLPATATYQIKQLRLSVGLMLNYYLGHTLMSDQSAITESFSFDAFKVGAIAKVGYEFRLFERFIIEPEARCSYWFDEVMLGLGVNTKVLF